MQRASVEPQSFDRVLSSMCTEPHPAARRAAERFLATNPGDPASYPAVADLEAEAIEYLGEIAGLDDPHGYITSGGTEANIQAVRAARNLAGGRSESTNVVAPESAHFGVRKAAGLLDVELRLVPTVGGKADLEAVESAVTTGRRWSSALRAPPSTDESIRFPTSPKSPVRSTPGSTSMRRGAAFCCRLPTTSGISPVRRSTR